MSNDSTNGAPGTGVKKPAGKMKRSTVIAGVLAAILLVYLATSELTGYSATGPDASAESSDEDETETSGGDSAENETGDGEAGEAFVRVIESHIQPIAHSLRLTGQVAANRRVLVRAETTGKIVEAMAELGQDVKKDAVLARIETGARDAQRKRAQALADLRKIELESSEQLATKGLESEVRRASTRANFEEARAGLIQITDEIENLSVRAPFAGVISSKQVEIGGFVRPGEPVAELVELDPVVIRVSVSEADISRIKQGDNADVRVEATGTNAARLERISPSANPATRTFTAELLAKNPDHKLLAGMTAEVVLRLAPTPGHKVPASSVVLADDGRLGVKSIDDAGRVVFHAVNLRQEQSDGVALTGDLPDVLRIITVGQSNAAIGDKVQYEIDQR